MLAQKWGVRITDKTTGEVTWNRFENNIKKIVYPAFAQPKLDGIRCIADGDTWSRTRKRITSIPHIQEALILAGSGVVFDGELYNHDLRDDFEKIVSAVRKDEPSPESESVQYHVYDIIGEGTFRERIERLAKYVDYINDPRIQFVETVIVNNEAELIEYLSKCLARGYEGCMVRNADSTYEEDKRSYNLMKLKEFEDDEFEVTDVKEGRGKMSGLAIFTCKVDSGTFDVKMEGSMENLRQYIEYPELAIGRFLTVRYQGFGVHGKPRFPVGKTFRDYE